MSAVFYSLVAKSSVILFLYSTMVIDNMNVIYDVPTKLGNYCERKGLNIKV